MKAQTVHTVGDELIPALYGTGELPDTPSPRWTVGARRLYDVLRGFSDPGPYTDAQIVAGTAEADRGVVLRAVSVLRQRHALISAMSAISAQLTAGTYNPIEITKTMIVPDSVPPPVPVWERIAKGDVKIPTGLPVPFTVLQQVTGGILGMWVVGGETGVGKSTFALQIAVSAAGVQTPVLYYDAENGEDVLINHLLTAYGPAAKIQEAASRLYVRSSIRTLEQDVEGFSRPTLIIVDSAQKFGYELGGKSYREAINSLIRRLEILKRGGHGVMLLSEISRASYGQVSNAGYAETRELEFSADTALQLVAQDGEVEVHVTKNRHRPRRGLVSVLRRERSWSFVEVGEQDWQPDSVDEARW